MVSVPFNISKFGHLPHILKPLQFINAIATMMFTLSAGSQGSKIVVIIVCILSLILIAAASVVAFLGLDDTLFKTFVRASWTVFEMVYSGVAGILNFICIAVSFSASGKGANYSFYFVTYLCFVQFLYYGVEFAYFFMQWKKSRSDSARLGG